MGWTGGTEDCVEGHHGTSLDVPYVPWGLRDGGQRIMLRDTMGRPLMSHGVPWGLRDGMDRWDRGLC